MSIVATITGYKIHQEIQPVQDNGGGRHQMVSIRQERKVKVRGKIYDAQPTDYLCMAFDEKIFEQIAELEVGDPVVIEAYGDPSIRCFTATNEPGGIDILVPQAWGKFEDETPGTATPYAIVTTDEFPNSKLYPAITWRIRSIKKSVGKQTVGGSGSTQVTTGAVPFAKKPTSEKAIDEHLNPKNVEEVEDAKELEFHQ